MNIAALTIQQIRDGLAQKQFSAVELTQDALTFAKAENAKTNAYLTFSDDRALASAQSFGERF